MKKIFVFAITLSLLTGCAGISSVTQAIEEAAGYTVTQNTVDAARESYVAFLHPVAYYAGLPMCRSNQTFLKNQCHDRDLLKKLQGIKNALRDELADVQAQINTGNTKGASAAYATLKSTLANGKNLIAAIGLK
jgi:uncharacterized protein YceK